MDYKQAAKLITGYVEDIVNPYDISLEYTLNGSHMSRQCYYSFIGIHKGKLFLCNNPEGCRESAFTYLVDPYFDNNDGPLSTKRKVRAYRSRDFFLLHIQYRVKSVKEFNETKDMCENFINNINKIEDVIGNKTIMYCRKEMTTEKIRYSKVSRKEFRALLLVPGEWSFNNVLFSAFTLLLRDPGNKAVKDNKSISTILRHKDYIFIDSSKPSKCKDLFDYPTHGISYFLYDSGIYDTYVDRNILSGARKRYKEMLCG
jgi:hypothetical protein